MEVGHATHFLKRLERLHNQHTDFALALYRDPDLVRFILQESGLPERAERIAIALEDRPNGPHIIVARDGGFVTCLGDDMSVGDCPVLARSRLDHLRHRFDRLQAAFALAHDHRETLAEADFIKSVQDMAGYVTQFQLGYRAARYRRLNKVTTRELRDYWMTVHTIGNVAMLCGTRGRELGKYCYPDEKVRAQVQFSFSTATAWTAVPTVMLQGVWATARAGRAILAPCRQCLQKANNVLDIAASALPLAASALRHRNMRGEARKLLERAQRRFAGDLPHSTLCHGLLQACRELLEPDGEEKADALRRKVGKRVAMHISQKQSEGHPYHFASREDVPDDIANYMVFRLGGNLLRSNQAALIMTSTLPWLARATATDLYPPERWRDADIQKWHPGDVRYYLEDVHWHYDYKPPARAEDQPGRNQPCPCGSGKKFKRCCLEADTAAAASCP